MELIINYKSGETLRLAEKTDNNPDGLVPVPATALYRTSIRLEPSESSQFVDYIPGGSSVDIYNYVIPDIDATIYGGKWSPLVDGRGWIMTGDFYIPEDRTVTDRTPDGSIQKITFSDGTTMYTPLPEMKVTVPNDGNIYWRVAHDYETSEYDYKPRTSGRPCPETCMTWDVPVFVGLTEAWQKLWFELMVHFSYGTMTRAQLLTAWADITAERKALTDNNGLTHRYTDYILGLYLDARKKMAQKSLLMGGMLVKQTRRVGADVYIECLDATKEPPTLDYLLERPYLWGWATEVTSIKLAPGRWLVGMWPNFKYFSGNGVPFMVRGIGTENKVDKARLIPVENGKSYSPYVLK